MSTSNQPQQAAEPSFLWVLIAALFRLLFKGVRHLFRFAGITIVWLVVASLAVDFGPEWSRYAIGAVLMLLLFGAAAPIKSEKLALFCRATAPFYGDVERLRKRKSRAYGLQLCEWFGLGDQETAISFHPEAHTTDIGRTQAIVWTFRNLGVGWTDEKITALLSTNTHVVGSDHVEVEEVSRNSWRAVFIKGTPPQLPAMTYDPAREQPNAPAQVIIGAQQAFDLTDGYHVAPALLPLTGGHTLLVGSSGSGKGSVLWSVIYGLKDQINDGSVKLWGIDLKGGMEFGFGASIFDRLAYTLDEAESLIDDMMTGLDERKTWMLDNAKRSHTPTPESPMYLLMIDEAAAFQQLMDSKRLVGFMGKLKAVLAQGRAAGYTVFAALQDPTKESFPARDLFTRQVVLRLRSEDQTRLALALGSGEPVPAAHAIAPSEPGTGFSRDAETGITFKFRAFYVSDSQIQALAGEFAAHAANVHQPAAPSE